jgi:hypothetical protein
LNKDFEDADVPRGELLVSGQDVRPPAISAHAERQHGRMLDEQQQVLDRARLPLVDEPSLQGERVLV